MNICVNAKVQRPSVCNAVETILVHKAIAKRFLPRMKKALQSQKVTIKGDKDTVAILPGIKKATNKDWVTEYNDLIV